MLVSNDEISIGLDHPKKLSPIHPMVLEKFKLSANVGVKCHKNNPWVSTSDPEFLPSSSVSLKCHLLLA